MSWLSAWFIFELTRVGAVPDLSEPQAFKNVSLQMMIIKHPLFVVYFLLIAPHSSFDVRYEKLKWKRYPFTASSLRFHENLLLPPLLLLASAFTSEL